LLIYEVTARISPEIEVEFTRWLRAHLLEMKSLGPIEDARLYRSLDEEGDEVVFVSHYTMASRSDYEDYLENHAPRMRADGVSRFGERFRASRRLLEDVPAAE